MGDHASGWLTLTGLGLAGLAYVWGKRQRVRRILLVFFRGGRFGQIPAVR